jgi:hypothetical protein
MDKENVIYRAGMVAHSCLPATWEVEIRRITV